jgi:anhydro-N-acetylmuramic acid kinase
MSKSYYSLGLMSGTSMDGVDASIIQSDGKTRYKAILDKYFEYPKDIFKDLTTLRDKIKNSNDLKKFEKQIKYIEKEITLFHAKSANKIIKKSKLNLDFIGFHGQTIFHNAEEQISRQLGDGKLLSKIIKKKVVYNFRQNDLKNGGQGAPLTPIFHSILVKQKKIPIPVIILNIGGITNYTLIDKKGVSSSLDLGPGNCLIDQWIRLNSKKKYDKNGTIAKSGKIIKIILNKALKNFKKKKLTKSSFDVKDFDISFVRGLSLEDGAATLTEYTSEILYEYLIDPEERKWESIIIAGGGRKNKFLIKNIENKIKSLGVLKSPLKLIDDYGVNGDFVESQAFAYLAIRSYLNLPISFPETTGACEPCSGGIIIKNF